MFSKVVSQRTKGQLEGRAAGEKVFPILNMDKLFRISQELEQQKRVGRFHHYQWWQKSSLSQSGSSSGSQWDPDQPSPNAWWHGAGHNPHRWAHCGWHHRQSPAQYLQKKGRDAIFNDGGYMFHQLADLGWYGTCSNREERRDNTTTGVMRDSQYSHSQC